MEYGVARISLKIGGVEKVQDFKMEEKIKKRQF